MRALGLAMVFGLVACSGSGEAPPPPPPVPAGVDGAAAAADGPDDETMDQLASLGYLDVSEKAADPTKMGVTRHDPARAWAGLNLYCQYGLSEAQLLDMDGQLVHRWGRETDNEWTGCQLLPGGDLLVIGLRKTAGGKNRRRERLRFLARYAWDGTERWRRDDITAHHELDVGADGDLYVLTLSHEKRPEVHPKHWVRDDQIQRIDGQTGETRATTSLYRAMRSAPLWGGFAEVAPEKKWGRMQVDLIHANTVDRLEAPEVAAQPLFSAGQLLVTLRHQNRVVVVDPEANKVVWSWGAHTLIGPHEGTLLPNGHVLIYDNGDASRPHSRVLEVAPQPGKTGAAAGTVVWEWRSDPPGDFFSASRGGAQRLPNGNTLVTDSNSGWVFELAPDGAVVWEFWNPNLNSADKRRTFRRMRRVPADHIAGLPRG